MDLWHEYKKDKEQKTTTDLWQEYLKQREAYGLPADVQWKKPEKPIAVTGVPGVKLNPLTGSAMPNTPYANPKARSREFMMASEKATQQQERYAALHQQYGTKYESGDIPIDTLSAGIENTEQHIQELEEKIEYFRGSSGSVYGNGEVYTNTPETPEQQSEQSQAILEERKTAEAELEQERKRLEAMLDEYDYYWTRAFLASQSDENYAFTAANGKKAYEQQWKERSRLAAQRDNAEYLGTENVVDADRVRTAVDTYSAEHPAAVSIEHMSDEEKEMFYYLVGSGNAQMAAAYANECAVASRRERIKQIEDWAGKNVWTGIAAHLAQGLLFPLAGADMLLAGNDIKNTGLDVSTNIGPAALKDSLNSGISQKMNSWGKIPEQVPIIRGKGLGDLYSLGVSMNESYGSAMAFGPFAIAFMGMSAASSTYNDAISRGASHEQAQRQGLAAGIAEALFEKISIGHFLDGKDYGSFIKNLLVQGGVEASEEALTSLTNEIVDRANMMNLSTFETNVRGYMDDGMSRKEAEKRANRDFWEGVAYDALGGFLTGGFMGGGQSAARAISGAISENKFIEKLNAAKGSTVYKAFAGAAGVIETDTDAQANEKFRKWYRDGGEYVADTIEAIASLADSEMEEHADESDGADDSEKAPSLDGGAGRQAVSQTSVSSDGTINRIARLNENYNTDGGNIDESTEILDDGGQRNAGMGTGGQAGAVAEGTGRSVSRSQARAEAAVLSHIKGNAQAQSPREIGVEDGSTEQSLYVLSDEDIAQSERWKRIKADAEADGARAVLFAGDLKVYNRATKGYSKVEGIHQTDSEGNTTYYIKADKHSRNAEQIYIHEKFHDIVSRNPGLLPALMEELEERYGQQEIAALVNSYVEAYDGIYGRLDESMTADEQQELVCRYMEEVFADVYAGIKRGARSTASAKKVMESQTDEIQRAAQNRKATGQKTAPPERGSVDKNSQKYSVTQEMTEKERYTELKNKSIVVVSADPYSEHEEELRSLEQLKAKAKSKAEDIIYPLAEKLGILNRAMKTPEVDIEFQFSKNNSLKESLSKQLKYGGSYLDFAKALINIDNILENAVLIEMHTDKYTGTSRENENLEMVYVLFGAIKDDGFVIPVQFEIKKLSDAENRLYMAVALTKIEADVLGSTPGKSQTRFLMPTSISYRIADMFEKINPSDKHFLKYIPDDFLTERQLQSKKEAQEEDSKRIAKYLDERYIAAVESGDLETAKRMVDEAAQKAGYTIYAYHGSTNQEEKDTWNEKTKMWDTEYHRFTVFKKQYPEQVGHFFNSDMDNAGGYGSYLYSVYLMLKKPLVIDCKGQNYASITYQGKEMDTYEWAAYAKKQRYDGVIFENISDGAGYDDLSRLTTDYVVFDSNRIKSADPVTYDNKGNVIPLSERFNAKKTDIRYSLDDDTAELDAEYARKMAEDDTPEGMAEDDEKIEDYNALARAEKERRAETASRNRLKSRIKASENEIRVQTEAKNALKTAGLLTNELKEQIDKKIALVRETLKIDKAALKRKEQSLEQQKKEDRKRQTEERIKMQKAQIAQKELAEDLINLFSVKKGVRLEMLEMINEFSDELIRSGRLTNDKRQELFRILYENGEDIIEADEYYRDVRMALKGYRIYVSDSVRAEFGDDWESFRKSAWGNRIYLTDDIKDMGIDSVTQEMAEIFGGHFDGEADLKTQLETILELAEEGKAERVTLDEMMRRHKNEYGWSIEEQMDDLEQKVDRILETFAEKASIEIRLRQKNIAQLAKEREGFRRVLEERQQQKMENQARNNVMRSIQKLSRMRKKASPEFRKMIDECLKDIDTVARSISPRGLEDLQELERLYLEQKEAQGSDFLSSPYVEARLNRLNKKQLDDMGIDEVRELGRLVCSITNAIQNSNKLLADAKKESIHQAAKEVNAEVAASQGSKGGKGAEYFLIHIDGKRFFGHISGWAGGRTEALGQALSTGQERMMRYQMNAMRIVDPFLAKKENREWLKTAAGKNAEWITIKIPDGFKITVDGVSVTISEIEITPLMRASLLLHSMNEDNLRHIKGGGIRIPDRVQYSKGNMKEAEARGELVKMDPSIVRAIVKECTAQEREFAKFLMRYYNQFSKDKINEVSMVLDGFERAGGEHYCHIKVDPAFLKKQNDTIKRDLSVLSTGSIVNERIHANNPIVLQDATDALMEHIESVSKYYGFAVPLRDLNAVLSHTFHQEDNAFSGSVMDTIKRKWGTGAEEYLDKLMADVQLPERNSDLLSGLLAKIRGNYAKAVISANLSSLLKQITSYPVAAPYLKMDGLLAGLKPKLMRGDVKTLEKYSAVYWYRNQGNATMELSDVMKQREFGDGLPWLFNATQKMDSAVTRRLLAACEYRVQKDMKLAPGSQSDIEAGTDRYWAEVAKLFNDVVLKTQSNSTMMERPQITRANASNVSRFLTMFKTDAFQQFNMHVEAKGRLSFAAQEYQKNPTEVNKKKLDKARKFMARTVTGVLIGQTMVGAVSSLLRIARMDDDEFRDEEGNFDWGKFFILIGLDVIEGYAGFIVGAETIYGLIEHVIKVALDKDTKWWDVEINALGVINDVLEGLGNIAEVISEGNLWQTGDALKELAMSLSKLFGIPLENLEKYLLMAVRWISPEWAEIYENVWDETRKDTLSKESRKTIDEAIGVLMDNRTDNMSDEDKSEIARLYMAGGTGAVPTGVPTSVSYTTEDGEEVEVELSAKQRKQYREVWSDTVSSAIGELLASEEYERADDEKKTEYIDKLYKYASQIARNAVVPEKELEKWVQQGIDAADNGIPISEYITFRVDMGDITGKNASGESIDGLAMRRKMDLLESMGWSDKQEREIYLDVLVDDEETRKKKEGEINALQKSGLNWDQANDIVLISSQSKKLKWEAIANMNLSQQEKADAMAIYANDTEKKLIRTGLAYGIKMEWYAEVMNNADKNGKNGVSQEEAKEYIYSMDLYDIELAYLWQMVTDGKSVNNPFSPSYGYDFWLEVHKDDPIKED